MESNTTFDKAKHKQYWNNRQRGGRYGGYSNIITGFPYQAKFFEAIIPPNFINSKQTVLEIGFGSGNWLKYISRRVKKVHGVDISIEAKRIAERNLEGYDNIVLHITDGDNLQIFPAKTFDFIYSFWVFQHMPKATMLKYLKEIKRVLKPEGLALFQVLCYLEFSEDEGHIVESETKNKMDIDIDYALKGSSTAIITGYSLDELEDTINKSGLGLVKVDIVDVSKKDPYGYDFYRKYWSLCRKNKKEK